MSVQALPALVRPLCRAISGRAAAFSTATRQNRLDLKLGFQPESTFRSEHDKRVLQSSDRQGRQFTMRIKEATISKDWDAALSLFRESPTTPLNYNAILTSADKLDRLDMAEQLFKEMVEAGHPRSAATFTPLINLHAREGNVERAEELVAEMVANNIDMTAHTLSCLIRAYARSGDLDGALRVWKKWIATGVEPNSIALLTAMNVVKARPEEARALLTEFGSKVVLGAPHFNCMMGELAWKGDVESVRGIFDEMKKIHVTPDVISFTQLLNALRNSKGFTPVEEIEKVLSEFRKLKIVPDRFFVEATIASTFGGDLQEVLDGRVDLASRPKEVELALQECRLADENNVHLTALSNRIRRHLGNFKASAKVTTGEWVKVISATGGADGTPSVYYWDRLSGKTQWDAPSATIIETVQQ